ncbi:hypothetical protein FOL46_004725 [Perkinsus olseni]|uniref:Diacylglycerol O-acyltransferase n=1 Tax=Perkinsus olseni TaxID=32597 RepID=A0A7J6LW34_PEROL|nr:hypothetical protein FOL46_004725 [Perkinsus olseni]
MTSSSLLTWFSSAIGLLVGYWYHVQRKRKAESQKQAPLPMTWLEAHMLKNDAFPAYMQASPICYVINSAMFFRDGLPATKEVEDVLTNKLLKYHRFSSVADPDHRTWKAVDADVKDHLVYHQPVADTQALEDKINDIISVPLNPAKPLWEVHMVPVRNGEDCMLFRTHHSMADGLSLVTAYQCLATDVDGSPAEVIPGKPMPSRPEMTLTRLILMFLDSIRSALHILYTVFQPLESSISSHTPREHRAGDMRWSGSRRAVLFKPFSLDYVRAITKRTPKKVTVNDVLLSATVGAIRAYSGETADHTTTMRTLLALGFPANLPDKEPTDRLTNSFSINACDLSKAIRATDPVSRVLATNTAMNRLKKSMEAFVEFWLMNVLFPLLPVQVYQYIAKRYFANHTMLFSNVPGPANNTLYFAGKEVTGVQGIFLDAIPEVTLISYNGKVYYNVTLDHKVVEDWPRFEQLFRKELVELGEAVGVPSDISL